MTNELQVAMLALRKITNQADLNVLADVWKQQMTFIGSQAKRGLKKGDVVVKIGDSTIVDMMSYMRALSVFEEGNKTKVKVLRDGKEVEVEIELKFRS